MFIHIIPIYQKLKYGHQRPNANNQTFLLKCLIINYVYILLQIQQLESINCCFIQPHFLAQEAIHAAVHLVDGLESSGDKVLLHGIEPVDKLKHRLVVGKLAAIV